MRSPKWPMVSVAAARVVLAVLAVGCSADSSGPLVDMLPADREVERWVRVGPPTLARNHTELYSLIDGAAPKYVDRGWQASSYTEYSQNGVWLQVAIHDMGDPSNAESIFMFDLPVSRATIQGLANTAVDVSLPTAYASKATVGRYYVQVNINDHSDTARASIEAFTLKILDRGGIRP